MAEQANWYDYPQYFDLVFRDENRFEVPFFQHAFQQFAIGSVRRVLEPGCGGGRLLVEMADLGYQPTGLDISQSALRYLQRRLRRRGLHAELALADMAAFELPDQVDAAFCTFNTFRHLLTEAAAMSHLHAVARAVRPGGIYILGFHIIPLDADPTCVERWRAKHGGTEVHVTLAVRQFDRRRRRETLRATLTAKRKQRGRQPKGTIRCQTEFDLRLYTAVQVGKLFAKIPQWQVAGIYDFDYDLDQPRQLDDELTDAVFILRRTQISCAQPDIR